MSTTFIIATITFILGAFVGIAMMCLLQINRYNDEINRKGDQDVKNKR